MTDTISLTGFVATPPRSLTTTSGLSITSFRLASSQRRYDRAAGRWIDADTNWYTVTAFRQLADNVLVSVSKGDRVVVTGRLRVRSWENGERSGTSVEIDADALGHDLLWGTTLVTRTPLAKSTPTLEPETQSGGDQSDSGAYQDPELDSAGEVTSSGDPVSSREPVLAGGGGPAPAGDWHSGVDDPPF